ncbi:MAG TPA: hypothetical protein VK509_18735, partial [Polyangiales bacterium]|nr:hypothetical protein [Polyangiales bacterium]
MNDERGNASDPSFAEQGATRGDDAFDALLREAARVSDPRPASSALLPAGAQLAHGRLSIVRLVGEGGMGSVYEAFDRERGTRVALKTLHRLDAAGGYELKNEFRALADV